MVRLFFYPAGCYFFGLHCVSGVHPCYAPLQGCKLIEGITSCLSVLDCARLVGVPVVEWYGHSD